MKKLAILLTCFNRKEKTLECLTSLKQQQSLNKYQLDIYLVDDGSNDGTSRAVSKEFSNVRIIQGDGNLFWNRGMYTAWETAANTKDYDYYLWLNDDTNLYDNVLSTLLTDSKQQGDKAIICGATRSAEDGQITYGGRAKKGGLIIPANRLDSCDYFNGNCVLIPRDVYEQVGNLDYRFRHALGDFDYGLRAKRMGISIYQSGNFIGECEEHNELPKWCSEKYSLKERYKAFKSPLGCDPFEFFHYDYRHNGIVSACLHFCTIHIRMLFPKIWNKRLNSKDSNRKQ